MGFSIACWRRVPRIWMSILVAMTMVAETSAQVSPWSDQRLPIRDGLWLWLDAQTIAAAHQSLSLSKPTDGDRLDVWRDGSGNGHDFSQSQEADQPTLIRVGDFWTVRFDGQSDSMRCLASAATATEASIFIVAAPHSNHGGFRAFFAANAAGKNDYQSGWNVDLGGGASKTFDRLNIEGLGFGGERNLLTNDHLFGTLHTFQIDVDPASQNVRMSVDGKVAGRRPMLPSNLSLAELTLGARFVGIGNARPKIHGPIQADIVELLVFDKLLTPQQSRQVQSYLQQKHKPLATELPRQIEERAAGIQLTKVPDPPAIQMLQDGFSVRELPLSLTNVNNVRFREDGRLVTLGYNGDLHLLRDSDGDGLEDQAELFWKNEGSLRGPIGLLLTPPDYPQGRGAFIASKGKVSLIVDRDGDDRADEEIVVATGWQEIPQNVDAVGLAMDEEGWLYFGLGTANYANGYLIDDDGKSQYDLLSDRGTVQRVSPDFSRRETVCTGIRFPIALAFNRHGDLFCSEQEGATWLANGNPFDELLHIRPSRHYGFPPRHPRHNPDVIDEPSTFDYAPQHQSTCGMVFNQPVGDGPVFGPPSWTDNAIVCGESRGKLWRTQLVKTEAGYVAASQLLACLQLLTVDACVAPDGDLIVACHSGPPDWGTGPTGIGKLFRIEMSAADAPRPVAAWAESATEIRIAFDRPLDPLNLHDLVRRTQVQYGRYVRAGDRFENLVPPYAVVQQQSLSPRYQLPVASASVTPDLRTLVIGTAAMRGTSQYAVTLPRSDAAQGPEPHASRDVIEQHPQTEIDFSLTGLRVTWDSDASPPPVSDEKDKTEKWARWIPHADLQVARELTVGSATHAALWSEIAGRGVLTLQTQLDLHHFLRPAVQPGSTLDYEWPEEEVTVTFRSSHPIEIDTEDETVNVISSLEDSTTAELICSGDRLDWVDLSIRIQCDGAAAPQLTLAVTTNEDSRPRPLALNRFFLPWAESDWETKNADARPRRIAEIEGGNWGRGRRVFHSQTAACFQCHTVGGSGGTIGPDLSNLIHRDYASILRDIVSPSYSINPDYFGQQVLMEDGRVLTGVLRTQGGRLILGDSAGKLTQLDRASIESMHPASVSIMPTGLHEKLSPDQLRDLMTYLLTEPPSMPLDSPLQAPPVRTRAELAAVLAGSTESDEPPRPLKFVLVAGNKDHGPGEHDYPAWQVKWGQLLAAAAEVDVSAAWEFPSDQQLSSADVVVFFQKGAWDDRRQTKMDQYLSGGGGAVYIHWAVNGDDRVSDFSRRIGLASRGGSIRYRHGELQLDMHNTDHPIVRNFSQLQLYDESYWELTGDVRNVTLLASSVEDGASQPQLWTYHTGAGRVFVSIPGHYSWTFDDPLFRVLLLRGIAWSANEPVDRFNELAPLGARMVK
jgi:putative heme-binding domain-containing protein